MPWDRNQIAARAVQELRDGYAVFQRADHKLPFELVELTPGVTTDEVAAKATAHYETAV